ncbi:MAG: response regulator [Balneolaceae bacterium]
MKNDIEYLPIEKELNVILAEDDSADRLLFEEVLQELPVKTRFTTVSNGQELLDWLSQNKDILPDVLFLDLNMPRKNGFAALGEIKRDHNLQNLPVFIFSTANDQERIKQVFKDAAHYYIRKPVKFRELKQLIYKSLKLIADDNISLPDKDNFILTSE